MPNLTVAEIERLGALRRQAMLDADVPALESVLAEELVWIHGSSNKDGKASFLNGFASGRLQCFRLDYTEVEIRVYGTTAFVTGKLNMEVAVEGVRRAAMQRFCALWVSQQNGARLVHWQATAISHGL
ncbi:MAG TPA: nuclear transport factor 2 family protein [Steroidobacteraceae bacterium]